VDAGEYDAIVLAMAGLGRLGLASRVTEILAPEVSLPAVGQGALGIECRTDDARTREVLSALHDETTGICVAAERGVLVALEGDCKTPIAAYAERHEGSIRLRAFVASPDGTNPRTRDVLEPWPGSAAAAHELGTSVGRALKG
jgi:hydroxymethylbilane synthase